MCFVIELDHLLGCLQRVHDQIQRLQSGSVLQSVFDLVNWASWSVPLLNENSKQLESAYHHRVDKIVLDQEYSANLLSLVRQSQQPVQPLSHLRRAWDGFWPYHVRPVIDIPGPVSVGAISAAVDHLARAALLPQLLDPFGSQQNAARLAQILIDDEDTEAPLALRKHLEHSFRSRHDLHLEPQVDEFRCCL